jgi:hypothetical protein
MPGLTTYSSQLIDAILRAVPLTYPADGVSIALHTEDPTADCTVGEVTGASYVRMAIPVASWNESFDGVCSLNTEIVWPEATEVWGNITHVSFWDENNNAWFRGELVEMVDGAPVAAPRYVNSGSVFHIDSDSAVLGIQ